MAGSIESYFMECCVVCQSINNNNNVVVVFEVIEEIFGKNFDYWTKYFSSCSMLKIFNKT